jgi:excisionase family DNA binding protein
MVHHTKRPVIEPNRVYSREEVAEVLNVSLSTVKRLITGRRIRASQPPGMRRVLILGQHILDFLDSTEIRVGQDLGEALGEARENHDEAARASLNERTHEHS